MTDTDPAEYVVTHQEQLIETTLDLLSFDTQNPPGDLGGIIEYVSEQFEDLGLVTQQVTAEGGAIGLVAWFPDQSAPAVVFGGHLDTVPFASEEWSRDPLGEREGTTVYGRGASDMKGAVAAMLATARGYIETDATPEVPVGFAFVGDEEVGGSDSLVDALELFEGRPQWCVLGEMSGTLDRPAVAVADKGSIWVTLEATGVSAHGSRPMLGDNAIDRLYETVDSLRDHLRAIEFDLLPDVERILTQSVAYYAPAIGEAEAWGLFERPTVNLGTFDGGDTINSVPSAASAEIDIRLTASVPTSAVVDRIREFVDSQSGVMIDSLDWSVGTYEPVDGPLVTAVETAAGKSFEQQLLARSATGGGDAKTLRNEGVSTVEFAIGTETVHAADERTTADALTATAATYAGLPPALATQHRSDET